MEEEKEVVGRIQDYLGNGGLFNPELMERDKVRDLIIDCREAITARYIDNGK